jgi:drug/metabolite transporter superfamily protein YnfA
MARVVRAAVWGGVLSGMPSTLDAWRRPGASVLDASLAAGAMVVGSGAPRRARLAAAVPVHAALSLTWTAVIDRALPLDTDRRCATFAGALAGLAIAALDLGVIGRRLPPIAALPQLPQVADHVLFGAIAGRALR